MGVERENMPARISNDEFHKRTSDIRTMMDHMKGRAELVRTITNEPAIPDQARDMAIKALSNELQENSVFFYHYLINFINLGMQGLHRVDFETCFTLPGPGLFEMNCCNLYIDNERLEIPMEIGTRYIKAIFSSAEIQNPDFILQYYRDQETYYDRALGEISGRCGLQIMEEIYPKQCVHVKMKLPAQTLIEHHIRL
jgi:hypothetical protein